MMNDSNSGWALPYLIKNIQRVTDSYWLRVMLATFFSGGKIIQSAGLNVIGVNSLLIRFTDFNSAGSTAVILFFMVIDVLATGATRAPKIYHYFLPKENTLTSLYASELDLSELNVVADAIGSPEVDLRGSFVFSLRDNRLYRIDENNRSHCATSMVGHDQQLLVNLHQAITDHLAESQANDAVPIGNAHRLVVDTLSLESLALFTAKKRSPAAAVAYGTTARSVYYLLYTFCCLSVPFSLLNGYVSGYSLIDTADAQLGENSKIALGTLVAISAIVSYLNFNLAKMHEGVKAFCQSLDDGLVKGDFGIPKKAMIITLMSTLLGIIAGIGWSYLITSKSLNSFPPTRQLTPEWTMSLIAANAFISIFPSIFASAFSSYELIKHYFPANPDDVVPVSARYPLYAILIMLIDSVSSTVGGFTGILMMMDAYIDAKTHKDLVSGLMALAVLSFLNNIVMYASLGLVGSKQAIAYVGRLHCCQSRDRDEPAIELMPGLATVDLEANRYEPVLLGLPASTVITRSIASQGINEFHSLSSAVVAFEGYSLDAEITASGVYY